ncbi:MAG TPA: glycosyltransferase [Candidatus Dormibacteraeota bacterium]|nr:glycosyltransferase [Candidatus Dormibacteraeota bacterium]
MKVRGSARQERPDSLDIAIITSPVTPVPAAAGGAQAFVVDLARALAREHRVTVYCAEGSKVARVRLVTVPVPAEAARALVLPGGPQPTSVPSMREAFEGMFCEVQRRNHDVVSQHAFDAEAFELSRGLRVLHTLHLPPLVKTVVDAARLFEQQALAAVSEASRDDWERAGVRVGRVLRNGVPDAGTGHEAVYAIGLIAGRLSPEKGVEDGVEAAERAGLKPLVVGAPYDPAYTPDLRGAERLGPLDRSELRRLMGRCAVTLVPIRWEEPFCMVAAEAQMAGCPVAGYRRGALPEVVEEGVSGFLASPDSIEDLRRAVIACRALDRRAVRSSAQRRLTLAPCVSRYERALAEVAGR